MKYYIYYVLQDRIALSENTDSRNTDSRNIDSRNIDSRNIDSGNTDSENITSDNSHRLTLPNIENSTLLSQAGFEYQVVEKNEDSTYIVVDAEQYKPPAGYVFKSVRSMLSLWTKEATYRAFRAIQMMRWWKEHRFCSRCGHTTVLDDNDLATKCPACHYYQYPRVQPCVIVAITKDTPTGKKILLAKDRRFTMPMLSVLAGYVEVGETLENAVKREVKEETALEVTNLRYMGSQPWPYPSNIMIAFEADYAGGDISLDDDELESADFYDFDNLPTIPPKGSISYSMIMHICKGEPLDL